MNKKKRGAEVEVVLPESFDDVIDLIERLKLREGVIVDFEGIPPHLSQRMLDFLSGAVFALGGSVNRIKKKTYILVPRGVRIKTVAVR